MTVLAGKQSNRGTIAALTWTGDDVIERFSAVFVAVHACVRDTCPVEEELVAIIVTRIRGRGSGVQQSFLRGLVVATGKGLIERFCLVAAADRVAEGGIET